MEWPQALQDIESELDARITKLRDCIATLERGEELDATQKAFVERELYRYTSTL